MQLNVQKESKINRKFIVEIRRSLTVLRASSAK
jgi:hypothetical protein